MHTLTCAVKEELELGGLKTHTASCNVCVN
jgi:hypothetical protein